MDLFYAAGLKGFFFSRRGLTLAEPFWKRLFQGITIEPADIVNLPFSLASKALAMYYAKAEMTSTELLRVNPVSLESVRTI